MRLKQKSKAGLLLLLIFGAALKSSAQKNFKYSAAVQKVSSAGFYKISLQPGLVAKGRADLSDIRLVDAKGNFVPYITAGNLPEVQKMEFTAFPQVNETANADTGTTFVVQNNTQIAVSTLWVRLKNTAVKRTVNLSGSDDLKKWFAIEEDIPLQQAVLSTGGTYLQSLTFPASSYHYLKLLVNDKHKAPVKFLEAGIFRELSASNLFFPVPRASIVKKDSNNVTWLIIRLNDEYLVNKVHLAIGGPKYYKRDVSVFQIDRTGAQLAGSSELNSNKAADIFLSAKTKQLQLQIANGDNLPSEIGDVKLFQGDEFIITYLESSAGYKLVTGNQNVAAPDYDLKFFSDSIPANIPVISHGPVAKNELFAAQIKPAGSDHSTIIWISLIGALLILSFSTLKMVKEVKNKPNPN